MRTSLKYLIWFKANTIAANFLLGENECDSRTARVWKLHHKDVSSSLILYLSYLCIKPFGGGIRSHLANEWKEHLKRHTLAPQWKSLHQDSSWVPKWSPIYTISSHKQQQFCACGKTPAFDPFFKQGQHSKLSAQLFETAERNTLTHTPVSSPSFLKSSFRSVVTATGEASRWQGGVTHSLGFEEK